MLIENECLTVFFCYDLHIHDEAVRHLAQCGNCVTYLYLTLESESTREGSIAHIERLFIIRDITA